MTPVETRSYSEYTRWYDDRRWLWTFRPDRLTYNQWAQMWAEESD